MTDTAAFLHELTLEGSAESAAELDEWIAGFLDDTRERSGFTAGDVWHLEADAGRARRLVQVRFSTDDDWTDYVSAAQPEDELAELFGESIEVASRQLSDPQTIRPAPAEESRCANCSAVLGGQYCGQCGQRASGRLIRFPDLLREAFGDLFEVDSRLWRTLIPLAIRPGQLTRDYLMGRRVRYMPPFRMYLVLSLLFFLVAFFNPRERMPILFEAAPAAPQEQPSDPPLDVDIEGECSFEDYDPNAMPGWLSRRLTKERLIAVCVDVFAQGETGVRSLLSKMVENIPAGLFLLLPVMAFILMAIHPLSGRYYVEHLLFVVHFHSFIFLILTLDSALARTVNPDGWTDTIAEIAVLGTIIYIPVYLYKSLRRVYESGHWMTTLRFFLLTISYMVGLGIIVAIAATLAAFSL